MGVAAVAAIMIVEPEIRTLELEVGSKDKPEGLRASIKESEDKWVRAWLGGGVIDPLIPNPDMCSHKGMPVLGPGGYFPGCEYGGYCEKKGSAPSGGNYCMHFPPVRRNNI